ncbi:hypothetical protein BGX31_009669 [Mortierella sp. GBA43]|nr:hypothetical protein BGX31_009669 [Mortierella sp. GBA43]
MAFGGILSSRRGTFSTPQALELAKIYLENAWKATDIDIILELCHDAEVSLMQARKSAKHGDGKHVEETIGTEYIRLGKLLHKQGHESEAQASYKKAKKLGVNVQDYDAKHPDPEHGGPVAESGIDRAKGSSGATKDHSSIVLSSASPAKLLKERGDIAVVPQSVFPCNIRPPAVEFNPPEPDSRLNDTPQLAICLELLRTSHGIDDILDPTVREWIQFIKKEPDEQERLKALATDVIRAFKRDEFKDSKAVYEVVILAPVLEAGDIRYLVKEFYSGIDQSGLLDVHQLVGLAQLIQGMDRGGFDSDDLVKILRLLSTRLSDTHKQSSSHLYQLTMAVSHVLDAMADVGVKGLDREKLHEPLSSYLDGLKGSDDPYLVYQASYAYQALLCVPDNETPWQATLRRTGKVVKGVSGLVSAVKGIDLNGFINGLKDIQNGLAGVSEIVQLAKDAYEGVSSLANSGKGFLDCLNEGLSFSRKSAWYPALRGADTLIRDGDLAEFKRLACEAPCRRNAAFQWGVCQRLGDVAANSMWDLDTRRGAITFLGEIYRNDAEWGQQVTAKQWTLNILMQLSSGSGDEAQFAEALLQDLMNNGDTLKQQFYQECRKNGPSAHPLKVAAQALGSPSLLDRVQERPDVEGHLRQLRRNRQKDHGNAVYIPPQAKPGLQASDETLFPLMEKVEQFLDSNQMVFLLLGDSGAGKSTFNRELEHHLWMSYKKTTGRIPLHINLPAIDKPEYDMIAKQLRKAEFTEAQIRELKLHRKFILICDGYDESQQSHNLYTSNRLNEPGEWEAKMVVSCRSEYLGADYRSRFQPGDRNQRSETSLLQEAVITAFSERQIQDYIDQYVSLYRPLWNADNYKKVLDHIPSLKDLVLPRLVDPGQDLSSTRITRVSLYDQFIEHWFERGKKRLAEKSMGPLARAAFENLSDDGFSQNGIDYLKRLSAAIYKEQDGQPIVRYSRYKDENTWRSEFFSREDEKQLLREACPLTRNGNQYRFIHRSLLEYGVALAIFDPKDWKDRASAEQQLSRRGSTSSVLSIFEVDPLEEKSSVARPEPDLNSPLSWRMFVNELSTVQFLEERVHQEPLFKQQLHDYIEYSKVDKKWRTAAANAITILVRAGVRFNGADLRGIRIPKADLSYGMFDSAQMQGADLRHVQLRGAWMRQADLSNAQMAGVHFGELPFLKQEDDPRSCAYSPDGGSIAVGHDSGVISIYSTTSWEKLYKLEGHSTTTSCIVFSPNGTRLASGSMDYTVRLWDMDSRSCLHVLRGHTSTVLSVAFSPGGDQVASGSVDNTARLWDTESGDCRQILTGHTRSVRCVVYSPNGNQIASCSQDGTIRLWNIKAKKDSDTNHDDGSQDLTQDAKMVSHDDKTEGSEVTCHRILTGHDGYVYSVAYSLRSNQIASGGSDKTVRVWDVETGECLHIMHGHSNHVMSVAYSPLDDVIASGNRDKTVRLWDATIGYCRQTLTGHSSHLHCVVFSPSGDQLVSCGADKTVRVWEVGGGATRSDASIPSSPVWKVKYSPSGTEIATNEAITIRLWDIESGVCRQTLRGHTMDITSMEYSPRGTQIASGSEDQTVRLWDVETGTCTFVLTGHGGIVYSVAYSPSGNQLASASKDHTVRLWDADSGQCLYTLEGHSNVVWRVRYSPDGRQIATCSWDKTIRLWDVDTGMCRLTLIGHLSDVRDVVFSPQGDQVTTIGGDSAVRVWDVVSGSCLYILLGYTSSVSLIEYSPDGSQIATYGRSSDSRVRFWDTKTGASHQTSICLDSNVNRMAYSPGGHLFAMSVEDLTVQIWDVTSGRCRAVIRDFQARVRDVVWFKHSNVNCLATACLDGSVRMWQVQDDGDQCQVILRWSSVNNTLTVTETSIQDVQGLSQVNKTLLKQRGAVGAPGHRLVEASKKLGSMASVLSKLRLSAKRVVEDPSLAASVSVQQLKQHLKDPNVTAIGDILYSSSLC